MKIKTCLTLLVLTATGLCLTSHGTIIVGETFGGSGGNLGGTTADTFDSAIGTAGGSATWIASSFFKDNGDVQAFGNFTRSAWLNLGSYVNDAKGTANGLFIFTVAISQPAKAGYVSGGFRSTSADINSGYTSNGLATAVHHNDDTSSANYFMGPGTASSDNPGNLTGTVTFTTVLDLRGWDGTTNFGSVTFSNSFNSNTYTSSYSADRSFQYVGLSTQIDGSSDAAVESQISTFQLTQVPEPATTAIFIGLLALGLVAYRRRR